MTIIRNKFDFDVGYLVRSPCKSCQTRDRFPDCIADCNILDRIQRILAQGISSNNNPSALETNRAFNHTWEQR